MDRQKKTEDSTEILDPPPNKTKRASSPSTSSNQKTGARHQNGMLTNQISDRSPLTRSDVIEEDVRSRDDSNPSDINMDIIKDENTQAMDRHNDQSDKTERGSTQIMSSTAADGDVMDKGHRRKGLLREKLLRLGPLTGPHNNSLDGQQEVKTSSQSPPRVVTIQSAIEREGEEGGEEEKLQEEQEEPALACAADIDSERDVEETMLSPETTTRGCCSPGRDSQISMCDSQSLQILCLSSFLF